MAMRISLDRLVKTLAGVVMVMAVALALLTFLAARRMERTRDGLVLSEAQLESALRLRAAPYVSPGEVDALLDRYAGEIAAEDRLAGTAAQHRREGVERADLDRFRALLAQRPRDAVRLDALTGRIVSRETTEMADAQARLAGSERLVTVTVTVIGLILLAAAALLILALRSAILRPIRLLVGGVERLRAGDADASVGGRLPKEFALLARAFNAMALRIARQRRELVSANARLSRQVVERTRALAEALGLKLDRDMRSVSCGGRTAALTQRECELLALLLERQGRIVTREQVLTAAWQTGGDASDNLVDVYVGYLRRKLRAIGAPWEIRAMRGAGFILCQHGSADEASSSAA
jgi:DNA-binding winged helix-turn-helix (wHTH) protein